MSSIKQEVCCFIVRFVLGLEDHTFFLKLLLECAAGKDMEDMEEMEKKVPGMQKAEDNPDEKLELVRKQTFYQKITMIACIVTAVVSLTAFVLLVPKTLTTMNEAQSTMAQVSSMSSEAQGMFEDLNSISDSLKSFTNGGESGNPLGNLDIEALNDSIQQLQKIVGSIARLFDYGK